MTEQRFLILDDDPLVCKLMVKVARTASIDARFTTTPGEFFALLDEWKPTHIAVDLVMPEMDGVEVMAKLAEQGCHAKVIISSGQGDRVLDAAGRSATWHGLNVIAVLPKPFSLAALRRLLSDDAQAPSTHAPHAPDSETAQRYLVPEKDLKNALSNNELFVVYQPKVKCASGTVTGFEALVRWNHPTQGLVPPDRFIPVAEKSGLIDELTAQVIEKSLSWFATRCSTMQERRTVRLTGDLSQKLSLSINLSPSNLQNDELIETAARKCESLGMSPDRLTFELTETLSLDDPMLSLDLLTRLRMKGFHLSIDDFGIGYSSMLQLVRLPFSEIKVDKSFVMSAGTSQECRTVINSVVSLGHSLGLTCTAEGLEDQETLDYLRQIGCDNAQGYFVARPMPGDAAVAWLLERQSGRAT